MEMEQSQQHDDPTTADGTGSPPAAAAAATLQSSPQRKRKHEAAAPADYMTRPVKFGKSPRDVLCTREQFEAMLEKSYGPRQNSDGIRKSGKDKHGHTLFWDEGLVRCQACNNKRVVYGAIVQHIIGEGHCRRVARIYRDKESITYSKQQNEEQDDASEKNDGECDETAVDDGTEQVEVPALPDTDSFPGQKSAAKKSTPKSKAAKKKKATKGGNRRNNNALTIEGGLVVNGLDIVRYIRGLEGRISELESKLAEASSASASAPTVV